MDYDPNNNVVRITEVKQNQRNTGTGNITDVTTMAYDLLDRETSNSQRGHNVSYTYDDNGNRLQVSSSGGSTDYSYDSRNRLISAATGNGATTYVYTGDSKQETVTYPNNTVTRYEYDNADRLTSVINEQATANTVISSFAYNYDLNSNRTQQVETQNGFASSQVQTTDYSFDNTNRLTAISTTTRDGGSAGNAGAVISATETTYSYDGNYNRTREVETLTSAGVTTTIRDRSSIFDGNNRLSQITDTNDGDTIDYVYDNNGNTLTKTDNTQGTPETTQFIYDSRNQLTQVIRGPPSGTPGNTSSNQGFYDYNYRGQRIRHLDSERGDIDYIYDDQAVLEERTLDSDTSGANRLIAHYRYSDRLISLNTATDEQYYHYSALRTTANLTNTAGDIQVSYRTDIWGEITEQEGDSPNRQVFTGQEHDENTGLIYFGARYYDPDTGIFINQDSYLGEASTPPSLNRYLYVYANPTTNIDPDGHIVWFAVIAYVAYNAGQSVVDTAADVAIDASVQAGTGQDIDIQGGDVATSFVENFAINLVTGGIGGKVNKIRKGAEAADKINDARKRAGNSADAARASDNAGDAAQASNKATDAADTTRKQSQKNDAKQTTTQGTAEKPSGAKEGDTNVNLGGKPSNKSAGGGYSGKPPKRPGGGSGGSGGSGKNINPDLQKRADAFRQFKDNKNLGQADKVSKDQFNNFRRGNAGKNGQQLYPKRSQYKDPKVESDHGHHSDPKFLGGDPDQPLTNIAAKDHRNLHRDMGQFYDAESGLHYNRHRYYDPETAQYLSPDPIGLQGGLTPQAYVHNPTGWVDPFGLAPLSGVDFSGSDSLYQGGANTVKIQMQGSRYRDFKAANAQAGYKSTSGNFTGKSHPDGYTWHHVDDYDPVTNTSTMQLVETSAHEATYPHKGSVSQFEKHHGVSYKSKDAIGKANEANKCACP